MANAPTTMPQAFPAGERPWQLEASRWFPASLSSLFCLLELNNLIHHPLWRDELQTWMIARSSHSITELLYMKRYEGHPDLWFLVLYFLTRFTSNPWAMQVAHLLIATTTVFVVARFAPFTRLQKLLFAFGYFPFFEYATISRNYALGMLFVFCFCAAYKAGPRKNYLLLSVFLSLLAQTSVYGLILSAAFSLVVIWEIIWSPSPQGFVYPKVRQIAASALLLLAAMGLSILHTRPPADGGISLQRVSPFYVVTMIWRSFVPIPRITLNFWNTNVLHTPEMAFFSILLLSISIFLFVRKTAVLAAYCAGMLGLFLFKYFIRFGALRHDGHALLLFLGCFWLAFYYPSKQNISLGFNRVLERIQAHQNTGLTGLLAAQAVAGVIASVLAFVSPFSRGQDVARYLIARHLDKMFIVGDEDFSASTVAGYLGREMFYPNGNRLGTFVIWDNKRTPHSDKTALEVAQRESIEQQRDVLALLNYPADSADPAILKLASFEGAVEWDENYYLYLVKYAGSGSPSIVTSR